MAGKKDLVKDKDRFSIIDPELNRCYLCGSDRNLHIHEIFHGYANRTKSKTDGCTFCLCLYCHKKVHNNPNLDTKLKQIGEKYWIDKYTDKNLPFEERVNLFIQRYGINYLDI